jgi:hypothetical protein
VEGGGGDVINLASVFEGKRNGGKGESVVWEILRMGRVIN